MGQSMLHFTLMSLVALSLGTGCAKGISQMSEEALQGVSGGNNNGQDSGGGQNTTRSWDTIKTKTEGAVDGWTYDGQVVVKIDAENQALVLVMPLPSIFLMSFSTIRIPELPGAEIFPMQGPSGSMMAVRIPLKYIVKGSELRNYNTLPNGDALPYMPVGENRGFAFSFPQNTKYRLHLYVSANAAAVFVETPDFKLPTEWQIFPTLGFPVKNRNKTQVVGYFAVVPNKGTYSSGVYVASRLPNDVAILIDELIRY